MRLISACVVALAAVVPPAMAHPRHTRTVAAPVAVPMVPLPQAATSYAVNVDTDPAHALNHFVPQLAFGAGVDGVPYHAVPEIYTASNVSQMLGAGLGIVSYRLYTELSVQDWHWNPAGSFSETATQGYWTSSASLGTPTVDSFGYRLPRRGFTTDQGNSDDFSRLDDGDASTFWKSNPYLTAGFTGESDTLHPQWVLYDLGSAKAVNAAQIVWANPYALSYQVQYWTGDDPTYDAGNGAWVNFPSGTFTNGAGGTVTLALGTPPAPVRFVRVVMTQSAGTCTVSGSTDARDCVGYAIAEAGFGSLAGGVFTDFVKHAANQHQTVTYASSVDPWHSSANRVTDQEQPGLDIVFNSGVTRDVPAMVPVPMLYSTPGNAAAEIAYLEARGFKIGLVELGEEPDGQFITPEDHAALYGQFATALHAVDPNLKLGGPVFEDNSSDLQAWPDAHGQTSWVKRWIAYLSAHGHLQDLNFFSFEHYPFGSCSNGKAQANLLREPSIVAKIMQTWRADNLPAGLPMYITETNYSSHETDAAQEPAGALWYADMMGTLLSNAGSGAFFYEYEPIPLSRSNPCPGYGSYGVLQGNSKYVAQAPLSQFFAARVMTSDWASSVTQAQTIYKASAGGGYVTAYPLARPDGSWAVLLVNRDLTKPHGVTLSFSGTGAMRFFNGAVARTDFGAAQYGWVAAGTKSHPSPDGPEVKTTASGGAGVSYTLPAAGITVLSGMIE